MTTKPSLETRALYLNAYADSYYGRPVYWPDGRVACPGLDEFHRRRLAQQDEWLFRLEAAKEWERDWS